MSIDFEIPAEAKAIREKVRKWVHDECIPAEKELDTKPLAEVRGYALSVMDDLVAQGVKLLVIACNTASSAMLRDARERFTDGYGIPVVEVIQPAVRSAVRMTRNKRIGVIGTVGTIAVTNGTSRCTPATSSTR